jgi:serine/threonine protein phosphatase 1
MQALRLVAFDESRDRLISVGDLIDRGPQSLACLRLLLKPWFHAVTGNHEGMLLAWSGLRNSDHHTSDAFLWNGGRWVEQLTKHEERQLRDKLLPLVAQLPLVIHVEDSNMPYNVLHAEAMQRQYGRLFTDKELAANDLTNFESLLTWGRRLGYEADLSKRHIVGNALGVDVSMVPFEPGLSLTYVGHSITPRPLLYRSHAYIDCGAYKYRTEQSGHLHLVCHGDFSKELLAQGHCPIPG